MKRLKWYDYITINLFWLGLNIRNNSVGSILQPYLVAIFVSADIRNTALGVLNSAGLVIAMLVQPAMGLLSDRSTSRFGRRRPFIFVGVLLDLLFLAAIAFAWDYISLLIAILLMQVSANISHGPLQALIPDIVPEDQRGKASGIKAMMELLPLILLGFTIARIVGAGQYRLAILAVGVTLLVIMLITMFTVKEEPLKEKPNVPLGPTMVRVLGMLGGIAIGALAGVIGGGIVGGIGGLIAWPIWGAEVAKAVLVGLGGVTAMVVAVVAGVWAGSSLTLGRAAAIKQSNFTWWVVNRLMFFTAVNSIRSFAPFFLMYAFKVSAEVSASMTGNLIMMVGIFTLVSALAGGWLSDRWGHRRMVGVSGLLGVIGVVILLGTIFTPNLVQMYVAGGFLGLSAGLFTTTNWALGTKLVPGEEAGRYLGVSNLAGAGAGMVGTGIGGPVADFLNNFIPGLGYFVLFAGYGIIYLLSTYSLRWVKTEY